MNNFTKSTGASSDNEKGKNRTRGALIIIAVIILLCSLGLLLARCDFKKAAATGEPCLVVPVIDAASDELDAFKKDRPGDYSSLLSEGNGVDPCLLSERPDPAKLDRDDDYDEGFKNPEHVAVVVGAFQRLGDSPNNTAEAVAHRAAAWVSGVNAWYAYHANTDNRFVLGGKSVEQDTPRPKKANVIKPKPAALSRVNKTAPKTQPSIGGATPAPASPPSAVKPSVSAVVPSSVAPQPSKPTQSVAPAAPKTAPKPVSPNTPAAPKPAAPKPSK